MSQYVLVDRPVILSKHKRNVISHGRPLSPIGSLRSISPYVPRQVVKGNFIQEKHGDTISLKPPSLEEYQKSAQENLISINNNLSNMLQETSQGIDSICQKVRMCLMEANFIQPSDNSNHVVSNKSRINTCEQLSVCEEEATSQEDLNLQHENEENIVTTKENEQKEKPKTIPNLTPFFTIINPKTQSAESVGVQLIKSISSKLGLSRKCTVENFQKSMKKVEKLTNYEYVLSTMVDDIKKEIDECYFDCQQIQEDPQDNQKKTNRVDKENRPKTSPLERRTAKSAPKDLSIQELKKYQKDCTEEYFENDLIYRDSFGKVCKWNSSPSYGRMDFTYAHVYRKRAITDLHRRMIAQVEANDSFIFFQKLMKKNRKYINNKQSLTNESVSVDNEALKTPLRCFGKSQTEHRHRSMASLSKKYQDSLWFSPKRNENKRTKKAQKEAKKRTKSASKTESCLPQTYTIQSAPFGKKKTIVKRDENGVRAQLCKCQISVTNNQPLSEPDRCKIHWMRAKLSQMKNKQLKYLDILDDISKKDLMPLQSEYPRRDEVVKINEVKNSYLYKLMYGKDANNKKAWSELFEPTLSCSKENCRKCSLLNVSKKEDKSQEDHTTKIAQTLSKYIFPDSANSEIHQQDFTVMPVHVFYDNPRINGNNRRSDTLAKKLPLLPMKETKEGIRKAEWTTENTKKTKPMKVVYDPILRKIQKEIQMISTKPENKTASSKLATASSWSPKNFNQLCSPSNRQGPGLHAIKVNVSDKTSQRYQQKTSLAGGTLSPISEIYKRTWSSRGNKERRVSNMVSSGRNFSNVDQISYQKDLEIKEKIQKDLEAQASRLKSEDRRIWQNKYSKSVGQRLLNFIEKQPKAYQIPVPKYALPNTVKDPSRPKRMLEQLRTLKNKNDTMQQGIQRAIDVIENKMVDLLNKATTSESIEAFDEMEKEITNVLSLMKTSTSYYSGRKKPDSPKANEGSSDIEYISKELSNKLDKILKGPTATSSERSSRNSSILGDRHKQRSRGKTSDIPKKSCGMNEVSFSSTSASGEEKFTVTAISPKRSPKELANKVPTLDEITDEKVANITSEIRKLKNELILDGTLEQLKLSEPIIEHEAMEERENKREEVTCDKKYVSDAFMKDDAIPVQEQIINLALIDAKVEQALGERATRSTDSLQNGQQLTNQADQDDPAYSIGDGDSLSHESELKKEIKIEDEELGEETKLINKEQGVSNKSNSELQKGAQMTVDHQKAVEIQEFVNTTDVSEPYFTPKSSPLAEIRDSYDFLLYIPTIPEKGESTYNKENSKIDKNALEEIISLEKPLKEIENRLELQYSEYDEEEGEAKPKTEVDQFYETINKIISRVESVYNKLEEFEVEIQSELTSPPNITVCQDPPRTPEVETDDFLTPFMHAVKDFRKNAPESANPPKSSPRAYRSPSYFNVLSFLDTLTGLEEERPIEVCTFREISFALVCYTAETFHQGIVYSQATYWELTEIPQKRSGCLKNPSSQLNMNSKSKQKVSFLLQKEEKAVQVTVCPFISGHTSSDQRGSFETPALSTKKDENVGVYIEASESKSIDKMSIADDESTYQSTFELTDEASSDKSQMPEQIVQNVQEVIQKDEHGNENIKSVVEIFRNNTSEEKERVKIKVFYDDYCKEENLDTELIKGFYNETSILQVKQSLNENDTIKRRNSLELLKNRDPEALLNRLLKEPTLLESPKHVNDFIDSKLLKEAIEERQKRRMIRGAGRFLSKKNEETKVEKEKETNENLLKSVYIFVYFLMFTALNLDYKCVH